MASLFFGGKNSQETPSKHAAPRRVRLPHYLYFVDAPEDDTVRVAIEPEVTFYPDGKVKVFWWDNSYPLPDRTRYARAIRKVGEVVEFIDAEGEAGWRYSLVPMTLELWQEKVRPHIPSAPEIHSLEELEEAYRRSLALGY